MNTPLDYLDDLARESARFAEALREAAPDARVPTCPDWDADDLLWHLAEVQSFWGTVVREGVTAASELEGLDRPERPADRTDLFAFYQRASDALGETLAAHPPEAVAWTWADEQTVGFIRRRQAHEALVHRVDAEVTAGNRTPMDARLSADGVDEALRIMYGGVPEWGSFTPDNERTVRLHATDTGDTWFITLGRFTGTDPSDNRFRDELDIHPAHTDPGGDAAATVSGTAADLDCWLWHRPTVEELTRSGDHGVLDGFESTIAPGID